MTAHLPFGLGSELSGRNTNDFTENCKVKAAFTTPLTDQAIQIQHISLTSSLVNGMRNDKLEDLKRSPILLNNVKIGHGQLRLIIQTYFVVPYMGSGHFDQVT